MLSWLANAWRVPELRRRVLFTAAVLAVYRLGSWIPAPGIDQAAIQSYFNGAGGSHPHAAQPVLRLGALALLALRARDHAVRHGVDHPPAPDGRRSRRSSGCRRRARPATPRSTQYTRYLTVGLAAAQSTGYAFLFKRQGALPNVNAGKLVIIVLTLTAGTHAADVDGRADHEARHRQRHLAPDLRLDPRVRAGRDQRVDQRRHRPSGCSSRSSRSASSSRSSSCRRASGASRCSTRGDSSGTGRRPAASTYMPLRVNMAGVIPVIFAAALLALPQTVGQFVPAWSTLRQHALLADELVRTSASRRR